MHLLRCIESNLKSKKGNTCIISCDHVAVKAELTYKDVDNIQNLLYESVNKDIVRSSCVALCMKHNVYIPSIIISLLRNNCAFMFVDLHKDEANSRDLDINWLVSYKQETLVAKVFEDATLWKRIKINDTEEMCVWKIKNVTKNFDNICYVIQTSGTTGKRKIVEVENDCISSNIFSLLEIFKLSSGDVVYFGTSLMFDPSMIELFLALASGSTLLIVPVEVRRIPNLLLKAMFHVDIKNAVTFLQMVPSALACWQSDEVKFIFQSSSLKHLVLGGETFPSHILNDFKSSENPHLNLYNIYGITEVSCWASICKVERQDFEICIGSALKDTLLDVRNEGNLTILEGTGELFIGSSVRKCRVDNEELCRAGNVLYRATGDLVKIQNNRILYVGRKDDMIKRFGHRINVNHAQELVTNITNLENQFVWLPDDSKLVLFLKINHVGNEIRSKIIDKIRIKLLHNLPQEIMPDDVDIIRTFPLTDNGKTDKNALKQIYVDGIKYANNALKTTPSPQVQVFKFLLRKYLGLSEGELADYAENTFSEIGGNSIMLLQLLNEYKSLLGFEHPKELVQTLLENKIRDAFNLLLLFKLDETTVVNKPPEFLNCECSKNLSVKWSYDLQACVDSSALVIENKYVAVGSFSHIFATINIEDGAEHFKLTLPDAIESAALFSPKYDSVLVGCYDGNLYSIKLNNGTINWKYCAADKIKCKPALCKNGEAVVFGSYDKFVHSVSTMDGSLLWKTFVNGSVTSTPILVQDLHQILATTLIGGLVMLDENSGRIIWKISTDYPLFGTPSFQKRDDLFLAICGNVNGTVFCVNCSESGQIVWKHEIGSQIYTSLVATETDNCVLFGSNNVLYCVEPSSANCKVKFAISLSGSIVATPCVKNSRIVVATTNGNVYLIDYGSQKVVGHLKLEGEIFSSPELWSNKIILGCRNNKVYCIEIQD